MSNRSFMVIILLLVFGTGGFIFFRQSSKPQEVILGTQHKEQSRDHIQQGQPHEPYSTDLPSSGPHYADSSAPAPWGVYTQEVPEEVFVHNLEHGGIVIAYKPDLPADQLKKLQALFALPYSNKDFSPTKALVTPRSKNSKPIQLAAWTWTLDLDSYDEDTIKKFYLQHVGKGPEPAAGPSNIPINQADGQTGP